MNDEFFESYAIIHAVPEICSAYRLQRLTVAVPAAQSDRLNHRLLTLPNVQSIVLATPAPILGTQFVGRVGWFTPLDGGWVLPRIVESALLFVGSNRELTFRMALRARRRGVRRVLFAARGSAEIEEICSVERQFVRAILRSIAGRISRPIKRSGRFAFHWGGRARRSAWYRLGRAVHVARTAPPRMLRQLRDGSVDAVRDMGRWLGRCGRDLSAWLRAAVRFVRRVPKALWRRTLRSPSFVWRWSGRAVRSAWYRSGRAVGFVETDSMLARWRAAARRRRNIRLLAQERLAPIMASLAEFKRPLFPPGAFRKESVIIVTGTLGGGGAERQAVNLAVELVRRGGRDVELVSKYTTGDNGFYAPYLHARGVRTSTLEFADDAGASAVTEPLFDRFRESFRTLPTEAVSDIVALAELFAARRPGVVHAFLDEMNIKAGTAAAMVGVPSVILSGRSVSPTHFPLHKPYMDPGYLGLSTLPSVTLQNNSHAGAADYADWLKLPPDLFTVVHNGLDFSGLQCPERSAALAWRGWIGLPGDRPVVGTIFRFSEEKRPLLWVRIAAEVARRRRKVSFLMVGSGPMMAEARALAEELEVAERLFMPGRETEVPLVLSNIDVFLLTSRMEGLPNVLLEAQAMGVPVVTTAVGGAPETLDQGRTGWAVRSDDPVELADHIVRILDDAAWRARAAIEAPKFVAAHFGLERMVDEVVASYAGRGRRSAAVRSVRRREAERALAPLVTG